ncbi:MAG: threonine/serine exporter family protein, partial [Muribaculaceae bacterium]|nr:threonine/serine exporter family protein [Muribaculaceae bacterium]
MSISEEEFSAPSPEITDKYQHTQESLKEICLFLSEYSAWLLGSGATSIRLERNVRRMANALDCEAEMTILPRHIHMTVCAC